MIEDAPLAAIRFDAGPLSWVIGGIRGSFARAIAAIESYATTGDAAQLGQAKKLLHQADGALRLADVEGVAVLTEALERLAGHLASEPQGAAGAAAVMREATDALVGYLEELPSGSRGQPARLFPYLRDILTLLRAERIHPADLFFPDTDGRLLPGSGGPPPDAGELAQLRVNFERGLLAMLRGGDARAADRKSTRLNSSHFQVSRMPSSA